MADPTELNFRAFNIGARISCGDPQDLLRLVAGVTVAHGFHVIDHARFGVEAHDEVFQPVFKGDEQQRGPVIHRLPADACIRQPDGGEPARLSPDSEIGSLIGGRIVVDISHWGFEEAGTVHIAFIDFEKRQPEPARFDVVTVLLPGVVDKDKARAAGEYS